jgi:hypothetical protein
VPELTTGKYPPTNTVPDPIIVPDPVAFPHPSMTGGGKVSGFGGRVMDETTEERVLEDISVGAEEVVVELETVPDALVRDEDEDWEELDSEAGEEDVGPDDEHLIADEELLYVDELL